MVPAAKLRRSKSKGKRTELNALSKTGAQEATVDLIDPTVLRTLAVAGTPEECATEIGRGFGDVADRVCAYFPGTRPGADVVGWLAGALRALPSAAIGNRRRQAP